MQAVQPVPPDPYAAAGMGCIKCELDGRLCAVSNGLDDGGAAGPSRSLRSCKGGVKCEPPSQVWGVQAMQQVLPGPYAAAREG